MTFRVGEYGRKKLSEKSLKNFTANLLVYTMELNLWGGEKKFLNEWKGTYIKVRKVSFL